MKISVNGQQRELPEKSTIGKLLHVLSVDGPVAVEINFKVCPRRMHDQTTLQEGDRVEIVTIVGGG
jgi:sulfur carrier protein